MQKSHFSVIFQFFEFYRIVTWICSTFLAIFPAVTHLTNAEIWTLKTKENIFDWFLTHFCTYPTFLSMLMMFKVLQSNIIRKKLFFTNMSEKERKNYDQECVVKVFLILNVSLSVNVQFVRSHKMVCLNENN